MSSLLLVLVIIALSFVLVKSADVVVNSVLKFSKIFKVNIFSISAVLLALTTSFPELTVGITSSFSGVPNLALGNLIGANIAVLTLVIGIAGVVGGSLHFKHIKALSEEVSAAFLAGVLPFFLIIDHNLSRFDGAILIIVYLAYVTGFVDRVLLRLTNKEVTGHHSKRHVLNSFLAGVVHKGSIQKEIIKFVSAAIFLIISAKFLVQFAVDFAEGIGVPLFLVGLLVLSVGTSLPELAVAYRSIKRDEDNSLVGVALGSMAVNTLLILGMVSFISPITISARREYILSVIALAVALFLFWFFSRTKKRLDRRESAVLLLVYVVFVVFEILLSRV